MKMKVNKERFEFLKYAYESVNADLKFAETKNTFLLTFNLAIIGAIVSFLYSDKINFTNAQKSLFTFFAIIIILSTCISVTSFLPLNKIGKVFKRKPDKSGLSKFMFYKYIYNNYNSNDECAYVKFCNDIKKNFKTEEDISQFEKQLVIQLIDLSYIANTKFCLFSKSLYIELFSLIIFAILFVV